MPRVDGSVGVHVHEVHEATALLRWKNHDVLEIEQGRGERLAR